MYHTAADWALIIGSSAIVFGVIVLGTAVEASRKIWHAANNPKPKSQPTRKK
jgi:diacylglycerol kinase